jgi:hypothetical protein
MQNDTKLALVKTIHTLIGLFFNKRCPLTIIARTYFDSAKDNFDIYLPNWLAKWNKLICTTLFILIKGGLIYRVLKQ